MDLKKVPFYYSSRARPSTGRRSLKHLPMTSRFRISSIIVSVLLLIPIGCSRRPPAFELQDNDRVLLLGNAFFERDRDTGWIETMLTAHFPDRDARFWNLGWSGDTVFGHSRAGGRRGAKFGDQQEGFENLVEHVQSLEPTLILIAYGLNESFQGEAGVDEFSDGFHRLLDELEGTKARMALVSPFKMGCFQSAEPFVDERNHQIELYCLAMESIANDRGCYFIDLRDLLLDCEDRAPESRLTENGIHLTEEGYRLASRVLLQKLGLSRNERNVQIDAQTLADESENAVLTDLRRSAEGLSFQLHDSLLPEHGSRSIRVANLTAGRYVLRIGDQEVTTATSDQWAEGVSLSSGPEFRQVFRLRQAIIEKNALFFRSWRPRNDAYISGERKYEQVPVHSEIPLFAPLIREHEKNISLMRVPRPHRYEIIGLDSTE